MDNTDSEMIESLNILRPPVRRDYKTSRFGYQPNAVNFMSEWRKPKKRIKGGKRIRRSLESSTSLILKRTSDSQIFDRYPVVSYTNTSIQRQRPTPSKVKFDLKEKPLIKVIVVPNDQPSEGKQSERNKLTKLFLNNPGEENAIETKNVYLVVTGRKKDKIYEIKTTESDTLLPTTTELKDEAVSKVFNGDCFKQLIKALNMERKKTNNLPAQEIEIDHVCKCSGICKQSFNKSGPIRDIDAGLSKVKIYGQLGLTEDDRYILKCNATVNDKPVSTTFSTVGQKVYDDLVPPQRTQKHLYRESNAQTDTHLEQRITSAASRVRNDYPSDNSPRRRQPRNMSPQKNRQSQYRCPLANDMALRRTQQTQRQLDEYPPRNNMAPSKTHQTQRKFDECPPANDMPLRRTQQTQRRMDENLPGNDIAPHRTQQTQRQMDEYPPGNYMEPRKTRESQCKTYMCPPDSIFECRDGKEVVRESHRRNVSQEPGNVTGPRQTQQSQSPPRMLLEERNSHESQATQANMNNYVTKEDAGTNNGNNNLVDKARKLRPYTNDKNTQCTCNCIDPRLIKGTQSPLVIISVYPNPEMDCKTASASKNVEANIDESPPVGFFETQHRSSTRQSKKPKVIATALKDAITQENVSRSRTFIRKSYRIPSRSPTPQNNRSNNTKHQNKVIETRMVKTNGRNQSPSKIPEIKSSVRLNTARTIKKQESKKTTTSKQKTATKSSRNTQMSKIKSKSRSKDKCNGNQTKSKSSLVDKYKKAINERVNKYNKMSPKHNVSAVSINIDSENECYDVSFHQGKYTTDLLVRKTLKNIDNRNESKVNFLPVSKKSVLAEFQESTDNLIDNDVPIDETMSKLNPRDSLELSHRHNLKTEIETQTKIQQNHSVSKDDTRYFAPIKHFTGDDCSICNPFERDREIQQLLGVSRRVVSSQTTDVQNNMFRYKKFITQQCFSDERECKDILYSNVENTVCSCCCLRRSCCQRLNRPPSIIRCKSGIKKLNQNATERHQIDGAPLQTNVSCLCDETEEQPVKRRKKSVKLKKPEKPKKVKKSKVEKEIVEPKKPIVEREGSIVERKEPIVERTSLYQQLILNRNIHVFLQVEQFSKQKPIILSKEQYDKVKKTIQSTLSKNKYKPVTNRKDSKKGNKVECECIESLISIGEVRRKTKQKEQENDETEMHTENIPKAKRSISRSLSQLSKKSWSKTKLRFQKKKKEEQVDTVILYSRDIENQEPSHFNIGTRQTMSSLEVRYASIAYLKHVTFSSTDAFEPYYEPLPSESSLALKDSISIETLFKGHKKSPTPNLGTSTLSCISEPSHSASPKLFEKPNQAKRPFLKRLMSCLVMRSDKNPIVALMPPKHAPTVESSFDSYHFSTSLGAIEMSSSLYDTSASFFSNHSVYPKSNKMKRSFLNSMRGFLHNRRS